MPLTESSGKSSSPGNEMGKAMEKGREGKRKR